MCGIVGIYNFARSDCNVDYTKSVLKRMTDCLAHRGPDGEGQEVLDDGHVFFGHRRLAVIDLSESAKQPMSSVDGRFTIVYNGEVYNYLELRIELEKEGYLFFSNSDTEVVMNAYAAWGKESFLRLNGIFAFAIWDNYTKQLSLVNDRYGTKPLYYAQVGNQLVFASEYKAILHHPQFERKVNMHALKQYFTFQNIFDDSSFLEGIRILPNGEYISIDYSMNSIPEPVKFWDYDFKEHNDYTSCEEYEEELERLFTQAVNRQLISDVEVGSYLSGGMDSGSITAIASKRIPYLKTFVCGFDLHSASGIELSYDERERAEYMSYCFGTEHYEIVLKAGDMERCIRELVYHIEDPRVGQSYPNYYATKLASKFVKVVLAGTGGDELFGGYPWRYYRAADSKSFDDYIDKYYHYWQRLLNDEEMHEIFSDMNMAFHEDSMEKTFRNIFVHYPEYEFTPEQSINYSLYLEAKTFLRGLLIIEDKLSMAKGLETRVPFLDNDLVDFALRLPIKYKLNNLQNVVSINENDYDGKRNKYFQKTNDGKRILRNTMQKYIPKSITDATKQGFSAPDASWFKGESVDYVRAIVENNNSKIYSFMNPYAVRKIVNRHLEGEENRRLFIWSIINFEEWLRIFG